MSPSNNGPYGIERVCRVFGVSRSTVYAYLARNRRPDPPPQKRGPKGSASDPAVMRMIGSLMQELLGQAGSRTVWVQLFKRFGLRISRKRVVRLMREVAMTTGTFPAD